VSESDIRKQVRDLLLSELEANLPNAAPAVWSAIQQAVGSAWDFLSDIFSDLFG
jgi:hypothetical protein